MYQFQIKSRFSIIIFSSVSSSLSVLINTGTESTIDIRKGYIIKYPLQKNLDILINCE